MSTSAKASPARSAAKKAATAAPKSAPKAAAATTQKAAAPKSYHKGNVAADLFAAANRLIESEGLDSLTVRRLCREVDVTAANFYNHYPSLEYLLLDVAASGMDALKASADQMLKRTKAHEEQLVALTQMFVEFSVAHPDLFRVMFGQVAGNEQHARYSTAAEASFGTLVRVVYGENIHRSDDVAWSHANCQKAYAFFAFNYGLARLVSMRLFTFPTETKAERQQFVRNLTLNFLSGMIGNQNPPT